MHREVISSSHRRGPKNMQVSMARRYVHVLFPALNQGVGFLPSLPTAAWVLSHQDAC